MKIVEERPHPPGFDTLWAESWQLDFAGRGGLGGFVCLCLYPNLKSAWWWTHLVGIPHRPGGTGTVPALIAVRDHEVPLPRLGLEVRGEGLWGELVCETPLEHWGVALEAFGVAYDDPDEAWGSEWGDRLPVGLDLEWETLGPPASGPLPGPPGLPQGGYAQPGTVTGEILVGDRTVTIDGTGVRTHRWGTADWWSGVARGWAGLVGPGGELDLLDLGDTPGSGVLGDTPNPGVLGDTPGPGVLGDTPGPGVLGDTPNPGGVEVVARAPVLVTGPEGRAVRLLRALGRAGEHAGWAEWLMP